MKQNDQTSQNEPTTARPKSTIWERLAFLAIRRREWVLVVLFAVTIVCCIIVSVSLIAFKTHGVELPLGAHLAMFVAPLALALALPFIFVGGRTAKAWVLRVALSSGNDAERTFLLDELTQRVQAPYESQPITLGELAEMFDEARAQVGSKAQRRLALLNEAKAEQSDTLRSLTRVKKRRAN